MRLVISAACLATCLPLVAQADHFTTSPPGYENVEGSTSLDLLGREGSLRYQQVISTHSNAFEEGRNRIAFRRDGLLPDNVAYGARTVTLELVMSETDFSTFGSNFAANLTTNTKTVIASKPVNFDDYTIAPAPGTTATEAPILMFDSGITWGKPINAAYLFDLKVTANSKAGQPYPMDADAFINTVNVGAVETLSNGGCIVPGQTRALRATCNISNDGSQFTFDLGLDRGLAGAPAALLIDTTIQGSGNGIAIPGWCDNVYVAGGVILSTVLDPNGGYVQGANFPYSASWIGTNVYAQGACADASQTSGIAVSGAVETAVPGNPTGQSGVKYVYATNASATTGTVVNGGVILWTNHP